jgi:cation diffusion facilitator CzcD-associated flavoprotein CzcO
MVERFDVIVIGGGQAGLSVGHHLARQGLGFVILDAHARTGDAWRKRWDSLRLFTPAVFDGLDGMPFPARPFHFPTKDEMADYLESYAKRFALPVRHGVRVERLTREGGMYVITAGDRRLEAPQVVVAMANYQAPRVPSLARELDPGIVQLHSRDSATRRNFARAACSSWALATPARRSGWSSRAATGSGWPGGIPERFRSASAASRPGSSSRACCCESSSTAC